MIAKNKGLIALQHSFKDKHRGKMLVINGQQDPTHALIPIGIRTTPIAANVPVNNFNLNSVLYNNVRHSSGHNDRLNNDQRPLNVTYNLETTGSDSTNTYESVESLEIKRPIIKKRPRALFFGDGLFSHLDPIVRIERLDFSIGVVGDLRHLNTAKMRGAARQG